MEHREAEGEDDTLILTLALVEVDGDCVPAQGVSDGRREGLELILDEDECD